MTHEIVNSLTLRPKGRQFWGEKCKTYVFLKKSSLLWMVHTNYNNIAIMTKKRLTKIVNFMTPGAGFFVLGRCHINHILKCIISLKSILFGMSKTN